MSKEEIKYEIIKVLDTLSDKSLEDILSFLKNLDLKDESDMKSFLSPLKQILVEDANY